MNKFIGYNLDDKTVIRIYEPEEVLEELSATNLVERTLRRQKSETIVDGLVTKTEVDSYWVDNHGVPVSKVTTRAY